MLKNGLTTAEYVTLDINPNSVEIVDVSFPDPGHQLPDGKVEKYALVIGVTEYYEGPLRYTDDDARSWANYLSSLGYNVILLTGFVDTQTFIDKLYTLLRMEDGDDFVVFAFNGHGTYIPSIDASAIVLSDYKGISQYTLRDIFSHADSSHIFFFFGACHIGGMSILASSPGRYVAMASTKHTRTLESPFFKHEAFTYYFLIQGLMKLGYEYMERAFAYAYECIMREWNGLLHPTEADGDPNSYFALKAPIDYTW